MSIELGGACRRQRNSAKEATTADAQELTGRCGESPAPRGSLPGRDSLPGQAQSHQTPFPSSARAADPAPSGQLHTLPRALPHAPAVSRGLTALGSYAGWRGTTPPCRNDDQPPWGPRTRSFLAAPRTISGALFPPRPSPPLPSPQPPPHDPAREPAEDAASPPTGTPASSSCWATLWLHRGCSCLPVHRRLPATPRWAASTGPCLMPGILK